MVEGDIRESEVVESDTPPPVTTEVEETQEEPVAEEKATVEVVVDKVADEIINPSPEVADIEEDQESDDPREEIIKEEGFVEQEQPSHSKKKRFSFFRKKTKKSSSVLNITTGSMDQKKKNKTTNGGGGATVTRAQSLSTFDREPKSRIPLHKFRSDKKKNTNLTASTCNVDSTSLVLNPGMDEWRMSGLLNNVKNKESVHSLTLAPSTTNNEPTSSSAASAQQIKTLNEEIEKEKPNDDVSFLNFFVGEKFRLCYGARFHKNNNL